MRKKVGITSFVSISRRIARPLLASAFIAEGLGAIRRPEGNGGGVDISSPPVTEVQDDTLTYIRVNGAIQVGGGVLLATGKFPRLAALALIGSIVPTTYAGHRFWEEPDAEKRAQQKMQLLKNLGLLGGLIFAAFDTDGAPSVAWRTRRRLRQVADSVTEAHANADAHAHHPAARAADAGRKAGRRAKRSAKAATRRANKTAVHAAQEANQVALNAAKAGVVLATPYLRQANESALEVAEEALETAGPYISAGLERAGELLEEALDTAGPYISAGIERAGDLLARVPDQPSAG
jgi:uncharacterized membrane protein YphA (DoxX/SURF4 family)